MSAFYVKDFIDFFIFSYNQDLKGKYFHYNGRNIQYNSVFNRINNFPTLYSIIRDYANDKYGLYDSSENYDSIRMLTEDIMYNPAIIIKYYCHSRGF
jgi:hypothetical protein